MIHDESGGFWRHARAVDAPVLATLHLPPQLLSRWAASTGVRQNLFFNCVSESQRRDVCRSAAHDRRGAKRHSPAGCFRRLRAPRGDYLLWIGRICEEKGAHVAIEVARRAAPPVGDRRRCLSVFLSPGIFRARDSSAPGGAPAGGDATSRRPGMLKRSSCFRRAKALLLPSLVDETSSLVAMEAMACGTPVVAFRRGAIPEIVRDGVTGFLVNSAEEMARAVQRVKEIDPQACRAHVESNFTASPNGRRVRAACTIALARVDAAELARCGNGRVRKSVRNRRRFSIEKSNSQIGLTTGHALPSSPVRDAGARSSPASRGSPASCGHSGRR